MYTYKIETQGLNTFRSYVISEEAELDTVGIGMLQNNTIIGLVPVTLIGVDNQCVLKYNVTSKITLKQYFTSKANKSRILGVFESIMNAIASMEDYMLEPAQLLLDVNDIYVNVSSAAAEIIYLPIIEEARPINLPMFFKNILFSTEFDQSENCNYVTVMLNFLNREGGFSLDGFRRCIMELKEGTEPYSNPVSSVPSYTPQTQTQTVYMESTQSRVDSYEASAAIVDNLMDEQAATVAESELLPEDLQNEPEVKTKKKLFSFGMKTKNDKSNKKEKKGKKPAAKNTGFQVPGMEVPGADVQITSSNGAASNSAAPVTGSRTAASFNAASVSITKPQTSLGNFGETTVLSPVSGAGETTVLSPADLQPQTGIKRPVLIRKKTGEQILIDKDNFRLGKEPAYVHYCITDNPVISRSHADIIMCDGQYYIVDNNSKNHTYVDGNQIPSQKQVLLSNKSKIVLANEEFEFKF